MIVERRVELRFAEESQAAETHTNLSAVRQDGRCLWVAGDETATIERLTAEVDEAGRVTGYGDQRTVALADLVELPAGRDEEADIEGLARANGWLWAVGSHSLKRKRVKPEHGDAKARRRLATVVREENRHILVRIPLVPGPDGLPEAVATDGDRTAAVLGGRGDSLTDLLADDPHLAPFLPIPSKDNGVDIEGIASVPSPDGERLYIGFRGPVLRGWAVLVEIHPETDPADPHRLRLRRLDGRARYRVHFLDLGGLGVRDLCPDGDDLLILAGPTMSLSGPVRVLRWRGAAKTTAADIVHARELERVGDLPHGEGEDHAEGIAVLDETHGPGPTLLVVYDSPAGGRLTEHGGVHADVVSFSR
ncbi:Protein of unknown function [Thermomonospora echinospora]|uniref:DUF3616 domain-containing protein n=1 Tax=Thermomonospora echinospora TaxID=1992 RepID=A0A1H6DDU9_9ACTN|nr:DUF3616 domain-containing protein [Thermomonospora echinospora]SEG83538.1 Protein of unknown function [Thermomonospora echinospora]